MIVVARFASELRACGVGWDHAIARVEEIVEAESITRMSCNDSHMSFLYTCTGEALSVSFWNTIDVLPCIQYSRYAHAPLATSVEMR
jgi:hypothetical protein